MSHPARRLLLGASAALAVTVAPAAAAVMVSPDAELIRNCARYLEIERGWADPSSPDHSLDCEATPQYAEYCTLEDAIASAQPKTPEGWSALAGVALLCSAAIDDPTWDDGEETRIARRVLRHLAGPAVVMVEDRRLQVKAKRDRENSARLNAEIAAREAAGPPPGIRLPNSPAERIKSWTHIRDQAEEAIRLAEVELARGAA